MKRHLLSLLAVAAVASFAGAQQPKYDSTHGDSVAAMHRNAHAGAKHKGTHSKTHVSSMKHSASKATHKVTTASGGEVERDPGLSNGGPGYSVHAVARDFVRADDSRCDALCQRERKMDAMCGKDRERCGRP